MPVPTPPTTPSSPPVAPQRTEPTTFSARMDAWLAWFNSSFWAWIYNVVPWIQARANEVEAWSNSASASATAAGVSQTVAAEATATATAAITTVTQQAQAASANSATISSVAAAASTSASAASASSAAAASYRDQAVQAWAAASVQGERLASISKSLHSGAIVESIIYDTSKDSDDGAWRKRMQDKSWYNETLGGTSWIGQQASEALARAYVGSLANPNLVANGTFATDTSGWTAGAGAALSLVGGAMRVTSDATGTQAGYAYQTFSTVIGKAYYVTLQVTAGTASDQRFRLGSTGANTNQYGEQAGTGLKTFNFIATTTTTTISVGQNVLTASVYSDFDNISVKLVDSAIDPANTVYQSTADGKFYRTNGNMLGYSEQFDNAAWVKTLATVTANSIATIDGTSTADTIIPSASSGLHYIQQNTTAAPQGQQHTISFYAKANGYNWVSAEILGYNNSYVGSAKFNLSTGAATLNGRISATANISCSTVSIGDGWYRCVLSAMMDSGSTTVPRVNILVDVDGLFNNFTGNGTSSIYLWGAQLELGPVALSYKPVTTTYVGSQTEVFRGISREFPAVVAIVAEASRVVIYDLTVSSCPMWMVFSGGNTVTGGLLSFDQSTGSVINYITSIASLNGSIFVAQGNGHNGQGLRIINFITEFTDRVGDSARLNTWRFRGNISRRNNVEGGYQYSSVGIVNLTANDVAVTVLDTAPIDPATGLPTPTIAVATAGGVSVIKDDGTVVNDTSTISGNGPNSQRIGFNQNNRIVRDWGDSHRFGVSKVLTPTASTDYNLYGSTLAALAVPQIPAQTGSLAIAVPGRAFSGSSSLSFFKENPSDRTKSMFANVSNSYATGWQVGDSRGAYLADTTAETITASGELVTNGTFTTDTSGWTAINGATLSVVSGELQVLGDGTTAYPSAAQLLTLVVGKTYQLKFSIKTASTLGITVIGEVLYPSTGAGYYYPNAIGDYVVYFTASAATRTLQLVANSSGAIATNKFDNVSCNLCVSDRSVKAQGLVINGTLTKSAVASGAGLVAYSGFSASNYLEQPYSANLDFGTGDFCVMGWIFLPIATGNDCLLRRKDPASGTNWFGVSTVAGVLNWQNGTNTSAGYTMFGSTWTHVCFIRVSGVVRCYVNGSATSLALSDSTNYTNTLATLVIGGEQARGSWFTGSMSLWRISATAPSANQIAHIYRTELPLFQAGAQCTLAGSTTAVTGLTYDDATNLLSASTAGNISRFKDLLRVSSDASTAGTITSVAAAKGMEIIGGSTSASVYTPALTLREEVNKPATSPATPQPYRQFSVKDQQAFQGQLGMKIVGVYVRGVLKKLGIDYTITYDGFLYTVTTVDKQASRTEVTLLQIKE